jgi:hypothetical protein
MRYNQAATSMDTLGPINNVPEVLRAALERPVTVVEGERQIACIVSISYFAEIGGDPERLGVESLGESALTRHEVGSGTPDDRSQRFCRLILHAAHAKTFEPLLVNGQPVAVVVPPPRNRDTSAPPKGPWIRILPIP